MIRMKRNDELSKEGLEEFMRNFPWCDRNSDITGYSKNYITVYVWQSGLSAKSFMETIYTLGLGSQIMYPEEKRCTDCYEFDISKGDFEDVKLLSSKMPEAVILCVEDWDFHMLCVFKNGEEYKDFKVRWAGDEPEPYKEDGDVYYDLDVLVTVNLPNGEAATVPCGGGMCDKNQKIYYDALIAYTA